MKGSVELHLWRLRTHSDGFHLHFNTKEQKVNKKTLEKYTLIDSVKASLGDPIEEDNAVGTMLSLHGVIASISTEMRRYDQERRVETYKNWMA